MKLFKFINRYLIAPIVMLSIIGITVIAGMYFYYSPQLPSVNELKNTQLQLPLRVYSADDQLIAEFGQHRRRPVKIEDTPDNLKNAFVAIEDARFYQHKGVDYRGIARAAVAVLKKGRITQGASTITMQVARNFYLTNERSISRKLKEALLALKIEEELTKEEILELYLNKIFLGKRSYGVGSAAEIYYGKQVESLSLAQSAMIAGLPKAPSAYNPIRNPKRAKTRRDYILKRMYELNYISNEQYQAAVNEEISAKVHSVETQTYAPYMAEMVRKDAIKRFGEANIYKLGLKIYTTLDSKAQDNAITLLRKHLLKYTKRHGYRGSEDQIQLSDFQTLKEQQKKLKNYHVYADLYPALVTKSGKKEASLTVYKQDQPIKLSLKKLTWARPYINENKRGKKPKKVSDVLKIGDIVRVQKDKKEIWQLTQLPKVSGALVSMNPDNGAIEAIAGGFDYNLSKFNRATQAQRQPGSSFKPFIYAAALAKGYSPATTVLDEPIEIENNKNNWKPENYGHNYSGSMRLRTALAKSKNLVSIRLLQEIGLGHALNYAKKFGFKKKTLPANLTLTLGTGSATPLEMATAYSSFANGGFKVDSYFIRKIINRDGEEIYNADPVAVCASNCKPNSELLKNSMKNPAKRIMKPYVNYQINSMLRSVAQVGTAARASAMLGRQDLAGKTGTTDDQKDAWFCGFTPNIVTTVWIGFDRIKPLGRRETAAGAALPLWIDFMKTALKDTLPLPLFAPSGLINVELDADTGMPPDQYTVDTITEALTAEQIPTEEEIQAYMKKHQEELLEKRQLEALAGADEATKTRQLERLRREAVQRQQNEERRALARQREQQRLQQRQGPDLIDTSPESNN
jgi:penicillin-binding protein 1A